jgi:hypothetical protein
MGEGPLTEHASAIEPENPPCAGKVKTSLTCPPRFMVRLIAAGVGVKSGGTVKVAVTDWLELSVMLHVFGSAPVHAPLHPAKVEPAEGVAVSDSDVLGKYNTEQLPPTQLTVPSLLVTVPVPIPARVTLSVIPRTKLAVIVLSPSIVTEQV